MFELSVGFGSNMDAEFVIREAGEEDAALVASHRRLMFEEMRVVDDAAVLDAMAAEFEQWARERLRSGEYRHWFAEREGVVAAGAGVWLCAWPSAPANVSGRRGNIMNVWTELPFRKQGLARRMTCVAIDCCRQLHVHTVTLTASQFGRHLYESLGFRPTNDMQLKLQDV